MGASAHQLLARWTRSAAANVADEQTSGGGHSTTAADITASIMPSYVDVTSDDRMAAAGGWSSAASSLAYDAATLSSAIVPDYEFFADEVEQICGEYENYTLVRFLCLSVCSAVALGGAFANILLFALFATSRCRTTPPTLYPRVLALLDTIICTVYILLFGADAAVVYLHSKSLFTLYHIYIVPAFVISRIAQLAIPYMLIFATLERFVWITGTMHNRILKQMYSVRGRHITVAVTLLCCVVLRLPTAWATTVYDYPKCDDFFRSKTAAAARWVRGNWLYHVYDFHLLSIAQTVLPFFVLLTFNIVTVQRLSKMRRKNGGGGGGADESGGNASADCNGAVTGAVSVARSGSTASYPPPPPPLRLPDDSRCCEERQSSSRWSAHTAFAAATTPQRLSTSAGGHLARSVSPTMSSHGAVERNLSTDSYATALAIRKVSSSSSSKMNSSPVRSAIYTMVAIVASYLLSNTLHLILTVLERSDSDLLKHPTDPNLASTFHTMFSDMVSFVYMFTSAIRILIYYTCNASIRADIDACFHKLLAAVTLPRGKEAAGSAASSKWNSDEVEVDADGRVTTLAAARPMDDPTVAYLTKTTTVYAQPTRSL